MSTEDWAKVRLRYMPSGSTPILASSRASGIMSTWSTWTTACISLPWAISSRWPMRAKPVTSVQAWTRYLTILSRALLFRVVIRRQASSMPSWEASSPLWAVDSTPMPRGLVSSSTSPAWAPLLVSTRSGWTNPVTASPYLGSSSKMLWPPVMRQPASYTLSYPPRSIWWTASPGMSLGTHMRFRASLGSPPMAYTSLRALVAAICPKR